MQHFLSVIILLLFLYFVSDANELSRGAVIGITTGVCVFVVTIVICVAVIVVLVLVIREMFKRGRALGILIGLRRKMDQIKEEHGVTSTIIEAYKDLDDIEKVLKRQSDAPDSDGPNRQHLENLRKSLKRTLATTERLLDIGK